MILRREELVAFFFLFLLSFLTSFMASTQKSKNLTCLYHDCHKTKTFDSTTTSTPPSQASSLPVPGVNYTAIIVAISVPVGVVFLLYIFGSIAMRTKKGSDTTAPVIDGDDITAKGSLQTDFRTIQAATHDFAESNKLGESGFGEVYKGTLVNGVDIVVKRLAQSSVLSEEDFKNEVLLLAKIQNRNVVRLLGFCLQGKERILVYECVPHKSLDLFLFDPAKKGQLSWDIRYKIIVGIARGILYLLQDLRLTFIHCNLKTSNILLDTDMNPKLADTGLARLFGMEQTQVTMKSDVYSFVVLLLEIISVRNNNSFHQTEDSAHDLITYAWRVWINGTPLEVVDPAIGDNYQRSEVIRCIQIGLLCLQEDNVHSPTFSTIILMLTRNTLPDEKNSIQF